MRKTFSVMFRTFVAIVLGIFFAVYVIQHDARFKQTAERGFKDLFGFFFDCKAKGTVQSVRIFAPSPSVTVTNVQVKPKKGNDWGWECERFIVSLSWFDILFGSKIGIKSNVTGLKTTSLVRGNDICITEHIKNIIATQPDLPFELRKLQINKGECTLYNKSGSLTSSCTFDCDVGNFNKRVQAIFHLANGVTVYGERTLVAGAELRVSCDIANNKISTLFSGMLHAPSIDQSMPCYIQGTWKQEHGSIRVYNKNASFIVDQCALGLTDEGLFFGANVQVPFAYIAKLCILDTLLDVQGDCRVCIQGNLFEIPKVDGKVFMNNIKLAGYHVGDIQADMSYTQDVLQGTFLCNSQIAGNPAGRLQWSVKKQKGTFQVANTTDIEQFPVRYWHIAPNDFVATGTLDGFSALSLSYTCSAVHTKLETSHKLEGELILRPDDMLIQGNIDTINFACQTGGLGDFYIKNAKLDAENSPIFSLNTHDDINTFHGTILYDGLRSCVKKLFNYDMQGHGTITINGKHDDKKVAADIAMQKGNIRLGSTYNFIQNFIGTLEVANEKNHICLKDCALNLHRGQLLVPYARCLLDAQRHLEYCYVPVHLQNVFLNIDRDVFVLASGRLVVEQKPGKKPTIKGSLFVDRGQMRQNIFSVKDQQNVLRAVTKTMLGISGDVEFNITIETKHPIYVQTGFLEAEINLQLVVQGSLQHPHVTGKMMISDGTFHFPYKPLRITRGMLYFMPQNLEDPAIELHAKGKIKRYTISMYVHGTLLDPHITFVSTPPLSQEQIITLLVGGSETGSLSFVVPSLVMQNVQSLIFGSGNISPSFEKYILSPLRYIRIVPSFTDQTGRGGFRGAIEIDVTDQLRAVIQKNFSLSEDTRFEVEYQVSDEISLRGLKDERGDIGGEVEMRFSF